MGLFQLSSSGLEGVIIMFSRMFGNPKEENFVVWLWFPLNPYVYGALRMSVKVFLMLKSKMLIDGGAVLLLQHLCWSLLMWLFLRNTDDVDKTMDGINEQTENMKQVQEALPNPIEAAAEFDEDELESELEELEGAALEE
ncbi:hypothetical protein C5167_011164 [Papaver somniferum]|uniref:Uncharacterized protein n=1 Tax=Papaver somniferum TaxID=3469 RepID=A0A4Y7K649_PAPSO|nr:hypothetical protein C5167_011164 [Papaver somniferum]